MKHMMIKVLSLVMALTMIMGMFGAVAVSAAGHTHTKGEKVKTVAPTCVAYGYTLYECAGCGEQYADDVLPKTEECQNIKDEPAKEATCTTDAVTAGKKCKDCGDIIEGCDPVPNTKLGHNYDIMLIQPTCTEAGAVIEACTRCYDAKKAWTAQAAGAVKNNENLMVDEDGENLLPPLNGAHDYVYIITEAPTCTDAGRATYKCSKCDEVTIENIYVAPSEALHVWVDVKDEADCLNPGLDGKECTECWTYVPNTDVNKDGVKDIKDVVPAKNHKDTTRDIDLNKDIVWMLEMGFENVTDCAKANTCTEDGFKWVYCTACKSYVKLELKATGHSLPNTANEKLMEAVIKAVKDKPVSDKTKAPETVTVEGVTCTFYIVSVSTCEKGTVIECVNTLCTETKATLELNDARTEDHKHVWTAAPEDPTKSAEGWTVKAPTCVEAGWTTVKCTKCAATQRVNVQPAKGHDFKYEGTDCTSEAGIKVTCKNCTAYNETIKNEKHALVVNKIPATCNEYAYDAYVCTVANCDYKVIVDENKDGKADKIYTEEGYDATNHSAKIKVEGAYYIPATCITEGLATYACKNCAATSWTEVIPKITDPEHKWVKIEQVDPTCQATGVTAGYICLTCADDEELSAQLAAKNKEITDVKADAEVPYKFGVAEENKIKGKLADGTDYTVPAGEKYVWVSGGMTIAKDSTKHVVKTIKFHRVGTCTMPELYLYECECGATWSKEGEKDAKNHNTFVYDNKNVVVGGTYLKDADDAPILEFAGDKHWGALLTYVEGKEATCTAAGNHNYVKCTGCNEVIVSGYQLKLGTNNAVEYVTDANGNKVWDCQICKLYFEDQVKANDKSDATKATGVVPCPGMTLVLKDTGKDTCTIDTAKTTWIIEIAATGHKTANVDASQENCEKDGYTAGVECVNAHCDLKPSDDGKKYVSGHIFIPKHNKKYHTTYIKENNLAESFEKKSTCTEYGINVEIEYCEVCNDREKDITKKAWYVAPLGHDLIDLKVGVDATCDDIGFNVYRCSRNCSTGSVWTDLNANGTVEVISELNSVKLGDSEYTWFVTDYTLATTHSWPKYDLAKKTGYEEGWFYNGEILAKDDPATKEVNEDEFFAKYKVSPTVCLVDTVYYIACEKCNERIAVADVIPAAGHVHVDGNVKTPISTNCSEIEKWYGFDCDECGLKIVNADDTTHDLVVVVTPTTCSNPGKYYWACKDCNKAFYVENKEDAAPLYELYTPEEIDWDAVAKELEAGNTTNHKRIEKPCDTKFAKIDEYVKATATEDGYFKYTCQTCGETVTKVLEAGSDVQFTINAADVLGSKVTANGNQIVVSIAYTAKSYKFRTLNTTFFFDNTALAFDKAEVKLTFAEELAVTTDVSVDEDYIDILTAVNVAKGEAELKGEDVAYVDLYFTVLYPSEEVVDEAFGYVYVEALIYNENGKLVEDIPNVQDPEIVNDIVAVVTGDVAPDYVEYDEYTYYSPVLNVTDLVALMDMVYTADAEYVAAADINKDGKIDIDDYAALRTFTASKQTVEDYATMMGVELAEVDYATMIIDALRVQKIDLNNDGIVNAIDYEHLVANSYNSYLETLYDYDMTKDPWEYYFLFSTELTVEDITDEVLWTYEEYLDSLKVEEEPTPEVTPEQPAPEVTPEQPAPEVTPETPAPEEGEGNLE